MEKKFILGLGAQKSGTTWLHKQLMDSGQFEPGFAKEYHIFDALELPELRMYMLNALELTKKGVAENYQNWRNTAGYASLSFYMNIGNYFNYFEGLFAQSGKPFTGDITPSYSGLSVETMRAIKEEFERRGIKVLPVFLMREPVNRLSSMIRMYYKMNNMAADSKSVADGMKPMLNAPDDKLRSDYAAIHERICSAFGEENVHFGFYETMFEDKEIERLQNFLGLEFKANTDERVNSTPSVYDFSKEDLQHFREAYQDRYDFVAKQFGEEIITEYWDKAFERLGAGA